LIVIDASIALSWLFQDELDDLARDSAQRVVQETALVPPIFPAEFSNALTVAVRRRRVREADLHSAVDRITQLPIRIDSSRLALHEEVRLAQKHALTVYDAMYLALARRHRLRLLTRDRGLRSAAAVEGCL